MRTKIMIFCLVLLKWTCIPDLILAHIPPLPHRLESLKPKPLWKVNISLALPYYPPDGQLNVRKREKILTRLRQEKRLGERGKKLCWLGSMTKGFLNRFMHSSSPPGEQY